MSIAVNSVLIAKSVNHSMRERGEIEEGREEGGMDTGCSVDDS